MSEVTAPQATLRTAKMAKRRSTILDQARRIIGEHGFDALTLRDLARAARVTVPTIYNLIGNKQELLLTLLHELVTHLEERLNPQQFPDPLAMAEAVIIESSSLFREDENFSRAALLVAEHMGRQFGEEAEIAMQGISQRAVQLLINACLSARDAGLLRGSIVPAELGRQMYQSYRTAWRDWAYRLIDDDTFRKLGLTGVYICLAADAVPSFHEQLAQRLRALNTSGG